MHFITADKDTCNIYAQKILQLTTLKFFSSSKIRPALYFEQTMLLFWTPLFKHGIQYANGSLITALRDTMHSIGG